ncbi:MAG: DUF2252 domain-containing protein [Solirubrobacterales bacterium]
MPGATPETDGRAVRRQVPRSSHDGWESQDRDPLAILAAQDDSRVSELVPLRYGRMLASPFAFYRGAAAVMAADLARAPATGLQAQLCGDAHLSNFGVFSAPDRRLVFDCNDFDETLPGPFEWDLKRLAASVVVAARERGLGRRRRSEAVLGTVGGYRRAMRRFASLGQLDVWYARIDAEPAIDRLRSQVGAGRFQQIERGLEKARSKDSRRALRKLTEERDGKLRIISDPPLITPVEELTDRGDVESQLEAILATYGESLSADRRHLLDSYRSVHAARKVVGVGSVGTRAWIVLLEGRAGGDPLFLQAKEAGRSVLEAHLGAGPYRHHGRRVVEGQRLMQVDSDIFLGWLRVTWADETARDYYVRQLWDWKLGAEVELMSPARVTVYGTLCGWTLARAHARSGDRVAIAAYLGSGKAFERALAVFAETYADQNERDHAAVEEAARSGRVAAERGV